MPKSQYLASPLMIYVKRVSPAYATFIMQTWEDGAPACKMNAQVHVLGLYSIVIQLYHKHTKKNAQLFSRDFASIQDNHSLCLFTSPAASLKLSVSVVVRYGTIQL